MDINRENFELGLPIIEKAGVAHKIDFREGPALPVLDLLIEDVNFWTPLMLSFVWIINLYYTIWVKKKKIRAKNCKWSWFKNNPKSFTEINVLPLDHYKSVRSEN